MMTDLKQWLERRAEEDQQLYEQYGKPLEEGHKGEYLAIGPEGQTILGMSTTEVLKKAVEAFGSGNFGLFRVGYRALEKWLKANHHWLWEGTPELNKQISQLLMELL